MLDFQGYLRVEAGDQAKQFVISHIAMIDQDGFRYIHPFTMLL